MNSRLLWCWFGYAYRVERASISTFHADRIIKKKKSPSHLMKPTSLLANILILLVAFLATDNNQGSNRGLECSQLIQALALNTLLTFGEILGLSCKLLCSNFLIHKIGVILTAVLAENS